jgi:hypothetical protein
VLVFQNDSCCKVAKIVYSIFIKMLLKMYFRYIIAIRCDIVVKHTNAMCGQIVHIVANML